MYFSEEKRPCITDQTFHDIQNMRKFLPENGENSIVIASHGMEFWTVWALNVRVGQERTMDKIGLDQYSNVILLQQKNEERQGPFGGGPVRKSGIGKGGPPPMGIGIGSQKDLRMGRQVPENFRLIYSSSNLNAYQKIN
jgi:hypothetical protein